MVKLWWGAVVRTSDLKPVEACQVSKTPSKDSCFFSVSKKFNPHCQVLVDFRNIFEPDFQMQKLLVSQFNSNKKEQQK